MSLLENLLSRVCAGRAPRIALRIAGAIAAIALASPVRAASYYFSSLGSDATGNGSLESPWQSIGKFNTLSLRPGDSALFRAGDSFTGKMWLDANDAGTNALGNLVAPVTIGSYGAVGATTRATIVSPYNNEGFVAYNAGGIALNDLEFVSGGFSNAGRTNGVHFLSDKVMSGAVRQLQHVRVNNVISRGFGLSGLQVWTHNNVGFADVQVNNGEYSGNGYAGVYVGATHNPYKVHSGVVIDGVSAHDNPGYAGALPNSGNGIVLANTNVGAIQNSVAYDNGKEHGNGNVAIWTYQSNAITIQHNLAYGNRSPAGFDGGAFDIDGGVTESVIQYNRSYDNDGAGLLLAEFQSANAMSRNVFRYNLSVNDGRDGYGGITVSGVDAQSIAKYAVFHNNTIVVDKDVVPNVKGAVYFMNSNHYDVDFNNNAFVALNGAALISGDTIPVRATFLRNSYWTDGGPIILEDAVYASVKAWAQANVQERIGMQFMGLTTDPQFADNETYRLTGSSPLIDAARSPSSPTWPVWLRSLGPQDLVGAPVSWGNGPDIGAREFFPADFNGDGSVDGLDLTTWAIAFSGDSGGGVGEPQVGALPDFDGDGDADGADFLSWQRNLGVGGSAIGSASSVPEPAEALLIGQVIAFCWLKRRS
jgi:hypothetical protein